MARVANWNPTAADGEIYQVSYERLRKAAHIVADKARANCPVGTISRPMYKTGKYAGQPWTARDAGALKKTIRIVEKKEQGALVMQNRNIRVYAGNYLVYYARIVEYSVKKFLRPALNTSKPEIKSIVENG